jgi:hypothetical protein
LSCLNNTRAPLALRAAAGPPSETKKLGGGQRRWLDMETKLEGGCLCGAIRYSVSGPALDTGSCHCRTCRRASSAPELPFAQFATSAFAITRGYPARYRSSPEVVRTFCRTCGSPLTYQHNGKPDRLDIMICSLDDPDRLPPAYRVWTSHKPSWAVVGDELPAFATTRPVG